MADEIVVPVAALIALLSAVTTWTLTRHAPLSTTRPRGAFVVQLPTVLAEETTAGGPSLALAPDGSAIAFVARSNGLNRLFVHRLSDASTSEVRAPANVTSPVFSPDSRAVAFGAGGRSGCAARWRRGRTLVRGAAEPGVWRVSRRRLGPERTGRSSPQPTAC